VAAAAGTIVVWTLVSGSDAPSIQTRSKISPMTWKLEVRLRPPTSPG
jgi:hypothetical protein